MYFNLLTICLWYNYTNNLLLVPLVHYKVTFKKMLEISLSSLCKLKTVTDCIEFFQAHLNEQKQKCLMGVKLIFANARPSTVQCTSGNKGLAYNKLISTYHRPFLSPNVNDVRVSETYFSSMVSVSLLECYFDILKEANNMTQDLQLYLKSDLSEENIFHFFHLISDKNIFTAQDFEQI